MSRLERGVYQRVREAAENLVRDNSRDTWKLADSLVAVPVDALEDVVNQLKADGTVTMSGKPYKVKHLARMRATAVAWPPAKRLGKASYRTHEEAESPDTDGGIVLAALCAIAEGRKVKRPNMVNNSEWEVAVDQVQHAQKRAGQWLVSANTLRIALGRPTNLPGGAIGRRTASRMASQRAERASAQRRNALGLPPVQEMGRSGLQSTLDAMQLVATIRLAAQEVRTALGMIDLVTPETQEEVAKAHQKLTEAVSDLGLALNGRVTDEALAELLEKGQ